jgi:DNA mismatch endonuclease (patch repair protein)
MADNRSPEVRSWNMSQVKSQDTSIEIKVRSYLFRNGFRFRKNVKKLPGKPDIVLPKYRTIIFIHGCFWHRHAGCKDATTPKTRTEFWQQKFDRNVANDRLHIKQLEKMGWHVIVLWECQINKDIETTMENTITLLRGYLEEADKKLP